MMHFYMTQHTDPSSCLLLNISMFFKPGSWAMELSPQIFKLTGLRNTKIHNHTIPIRTFYIIEDTINNLIKKNSLIGLDPKLVMLTIGLLKIMRFNLTRTTVLWFQPVFSSSDYICTLLVKKCSTFFNFLY